MDKVCSAYFLYLQKKEEKMLNPKASIVTLTYFGAEKTIEGYNVMGVAKAALQSSIRYIEIKWWTGKSLSNFIYDTRKIAVLFYCYFCISR